MVKCDWQWDLLSLCWKCSAWNRRWNYVLKCVHQPIYIQCKASIFNEQFIRVNLNEQSFNWFSDWNYHFQSNLSCSSAEWDRVVFDGNIISLTFEQVVFHIKICWFPKESLFCFDCFKSRVSSVLLLVNKQLISTVQRHIWIQNKIFVKKCLNFFLF